MIYGYARVSTKYQRIARQITAIESVFPDKKIKIYQEAFTGTEMEGRTEFNKLLKAVREGDTIVFDSVSRMSRNADEGTAQYFELYNKGVNLIFINEPYINTATYKEQQTDKIDLIGTDEDILFDAINRYLWRLAERQIRIAFEQSEKEVVDIHTRTKKGLESARSKGIVIGGTVNKGKTYSVKKKEARKAEILKKSKTFNGHMTDRDLMKVMGIANNTYYKYKKELLQEQGKA